MKCCEELQSVVNCYEVLQSVMKCCEVLGSVVKRCEYDNRSSRYITTHSQYQTVFGKKYKKVCQACIGSNML